jgi:hypothetical protein
MTDTTTHVDEAVDLNTVNEILQDAVPLMLSLNGTPITADKHATAAATRSLLELADKLALASTLVRNEYWHARGGPSYGL